MNHAEYGRDAAYFEKAMDELRESFAFSGVDVVTEDIETQENMAGNIGRRQVQDLDLAAKRGREAAPENAT